MKAALALDASNRILLSKELRQTANVSGRIVKRGKLKVWTGAVSPTPIEEAIKQLRHHAR
jgi:hypothetical protein